MVLCLKNLISNKTYNVVSEQANLLKLSKLLRICSVGAKLPTPEQIAPEQNAHGEQITPEQGFAQIEQIAPEHRVAHREHFCSDAICSL